MLVLLDDDIVGCSCSERSSEKKKEVPLPKPNRIWRARPRARYTQKPSEESDYEIGYSVYMNGRTNATSTNVNDNGLV